MWSREARRLTRQSPMTRLHFGLMVATASFASKSKADDECGWLLAQDKPEPTQRMPKDAEIPVPKRSEFLRDMENVAPPAKQDDEREPDSPADDVPEQ